MFWISLPYKYCTYSVVLQIASVGLFNLVLTRGASGYSSLVLSLCHSFIHSLYHLTGWSSFLQIGAPWVLYEQTCHRVLANIIELNFQMKAWLRSKAGKSYEASTFLPLMYPAGKVRLLTEAQKRVCIHVNSS